jgi:F-type H+-transporting ATPase subunit b
MELDWSTFFLEIINFLILVWILKRFLYRPVLDVIARRREGVEKTLNEAKTLHAEAEAMKVQYQRRLSDWEQEKVQAWENLQRELDAERVRQRDQLQNTLAQEREKRRILEERHLDELARRKEVAALSLAGRFIRRVLDRLACPELEERIIQWTLEELKNLPSERWATLKTNTQPDRALVQINTAFPIAEARRHELQEALNRLLEHTARYEFHQEPELIAGLRICIGPWVVQANLHEELRLFSEVFHADL